MEIPSGPEPRSPLWSLLGLALAVSACKGEAKDSARPATPAEKPAEKPGFAGIVFDVGGIDDKSFNEAAHKGLMRAKDELGIAVDFYQPSQPADRKTGLRRLVGKKFEIVIGVGFIFTDELIALAKEFPERRFACIDMVEKPEAEIPTNLVGLKFREEQGSFLVGALAALTTKTKKLGFVGGMNVPLIHKFEAGFRAGAKHAVPDIEVLSNYAGETPKAFDDPETGKSLALGMYKSGVDIIFHASGKTGLGVFQAAKETNNFVIGVDADQSSEAPGRVLTSMTKQVDIAVFDAVKSVKEGTFKSGLRVFGLAEGGVDFVYNDSNKALIPAGVYEKVMAMKADIVAGKIQVPATR
ncbi:MAG: BMP family ABC transporter substrate-binding protein [Deltaproteobacteria bacterium]|nr:BMP family ABC transporter substrate-binding protein [Deltaproteobacteria bacterium]